MDLIKGEYYQELLEFPTNYKFGMENLSIEHCSKFSIWKSMKSFLLKNKPKNIIVSLSGGVDSMVIFAILVSLQSEFKFNLTTASINYNLREEASDEMHFIKGYTFRYEKDIPINYLATISGFSRKKEDSGKRSEFEEQSRNIRFNLYHQIIKENDWVIDDTIIMVGHHQDDLIENIFNNFMQGRDLTDLPVMTELSVNRGIKMGRPFLSHPKKDIYDYSHKHNIPYFKNTTPEWSKRGQMREVLFPLLDKIYNCNWKQKMLNQGNTSDTLDEIVKTSLEKEIKEIDNQIIFNKRETMSWNQYLWSKKLSEVLHNRGLKMVSQKALKKFTQDIKRSNLKGCLNDKITYLIDDIEIKICLEKKLI